MASDLNVKEAEGRALLAANLATGENREALEGYGRDYLALADLARRLAVFADEQLCECFDEWSEPRPNRPCDVCRLGAEARKAGLLEVRG